MLIWQRCHALPPACPPAIAAFRPIPYMPRPSLSRFTPPDAGSALSPPTAHRRFRCHMPHLAAFTNARVDLPGDEGGRLR